MFKEFKEFALKGIIIDLAVGVIIGGAFQSIVNSLVNDIIMPLTGAFTGNVDYTAWVITFGTVSIKIGSFITAIINFLLVAFSLFLFIKYVNKLNAKIEQLGKDGKKALTKKFKKNDKVVEEVIEPEPTTKTCPYCLSEINVKATRCPHCTSELK